MAFSPKWIQGVEYRVVVYCNGRTDVDRFDKQLQFEISLIPYIGDTAWVADTIQKAYECLCATEIMGRSPECDFCQYTQALEKYNGR